MLAHRRGAAEAVGAPLARGAPVRLRVLEMVQLVLAVMEADLEPALGEGAGGEIAFQAIDCGRFRSALDWAPAVDLATAMERTVDWYRRAAVQAALAGPRGGWA